MEAIDQAIAMPADNSPMQPLDNMRPPRQSMLIVEPARDIPPFIANAALPMMLTHQIVEYQNVVEAAQLHTMNPTHQPLVKCDLSVEVTEIDFCTGSDKACIDAKICSGSGAENPDVGF